MRYNKFILAIFCVLVISACENAGKRTVFSALQEQSKFECELSMSERCPRSPEPYDEYAWHRKQYLKQQPGAVSQ